MAILVRFTPSNVSSQKYDEALNRMNNEMGDGLPGGCQARVAFKRPDGNIQVSEVWDSREQFSVYIEQVMPLLSELGIDPGEPEILDIHDIELR